MLWLKAFHIVFVVTWFAGLFYLPRLFVYHALAPEPSARERFGVMERRLFGIMTIGGTLAGVTDVSTVGPPPGSGWALAEAVGHPWLVAGPPRVTVVAAVGWAEVVYGQVGVDDDVATLTSGVGGLARTGRPVVADVKWTRRQSASGTARILPQGGLSAWSLLRSSLVVNGSLGKSSRCWICSGRTPAASSFSR